MPTKVNLDSLIKREDFEILKETDDPSTTLDRIQINHLERGDFFYKWLRKPDFQRETSEWSPQKVTNFIKSFVDGDLIPSIIVWSHGSYTFVIDGAHRLSALIAWVLDDYGDGQITRELYGNKIPRDQLKHAETTRKLVKKTIGSYQELKNVENSEKYTFDIKERASRLSRCALQLQWVRGDARKAEDSFYKINQLATQIDPNEFTLIKSRRKPNAIAARAIIRAGCGHKYWNKFKDDIQTEIEELSNELNKLLFEPDIDTPIRTLDLPAAGKVYSSLTLPLVFELVNIANDIDNKTDLSDDVSGEETIVYLKKTRKLVYRITGKNPSSLGLHPAIYFYKITGRYDQTSFLAIIKMFKDWEDQSNNFKKFINVRKDIESFLLKYKEIPSQIAYKFGSGVKSYEKLYLLFKTIFNQLVDGKSEDDIINALANDKLFAFLKFAKDVADVTSKQFSNNAKSAIFFREALSNPVKCKICEGYIHRNSVTIDHIKRKQDGGLGSTDNGQIAHPYCNTTVKN